MSMDYIAKCPECKGICGWMSESLPKKDLAKETGRWIREGFGLERIETEDARKAPFGHAAGCSLDPRPKNKSKPKREQSNLFAEAYQGAVE